MFDPYADDSPGISDPASDLLPITPSDVDDIERGIKSLRVFNTGDSPVQYTVTLVSGRKLALFVPGNALLIEPIRITRLWDTGTDAALLFHGYNDATSL